MVKTLKKIQTSKRDATMLVYDDIMCQFVFVGPDQLITHLRPPTLLLRAPIWPRQSGQALTPPPPVHPTEPVIDDESDIDSEGEKEAKGQSNEETSSHASPLVDEGNSEDEMAPPEESLTRRKKGKSLVVPPQDVLVMTREDQDIEGGKGEDKSDGDQVV